MWKLLKHQIRVSLKDRRYFFVLLAFLLFLFVLIFSGLSVFLNYNAIGNDISKNKLDVDYYINYAARGWGSSSLNILSPFETEESKPYVEYDDSPDMQTYQFPSLSLEDGVIFDFSGNRILLENELSQASKGDTNKFNVFDFLKNKDIVSENYLYYIDHLNIIHNFNNYLVSYYSQNNKDLDVLFNNIFKKHSDEDKTPTIHITSTNGGEGVALDVDSSEMYSIGLQSIGQIVNVEIQDNFDTNNPVSESIKQYVYFDSINNSQLSIGNLGFVYDFNLHGLLLGSIGSGLVALGDSGLYGSSWFDSQIKKGIRNLDFYITYTSEIANKYNFDISYYNTLTYSNKKAGVKYLFVDRTMSSNGINYNNALRLKITDQYEYNEGRDDNFVISNRYATRNKIDVQKGASFDLKLPNAGVVSKPIKAIGYDYNNTYPLIYDSDFIPDTKVEATVFITENVFKTSNPEDGGIPDSLLAENSKLYFSYHGTNMESDINSLQAKLNYDPTHSPNGTVLNNAKNITNVLRSSVINYFSTFFLYSFLILFAIFLVIALVSIYVITTKDITKKMQMLGILKANGQYRWEVALEYGIKALLPTLFAGIIGYGVMFLIQIFINSQVSYLIDVPVHLNVFVQWFFLIWIVICLILFAFAYFVAFKQLGRNTIDLLNKQTKVKHKNQLLNLIDRMKINHYNTKLLFKQFAVSWKKITSLSVTIFVASILSALVIDAPTIVATVKKDYYANLHYNLANEYQQPTINAPLSYYSSYDNEANYDSLLPAAFENKNDFVVSKDYANADQEYLMNTIGLNMVSLKNKHMSIDSITNMLDQLGDGSVRTYIEDTFINDFFLSKFMVSMFGGSVAENSSWEDKIGSIVSGRMPAELLEYWNSPEIRKSFSIDIQSTPYQKDTDTLATVLQGNEVSSAGSLSVYGLANDNLYNMDISKLNSSDEVVATKKLLSTFHKKVGDQITVNTSQQKLMFLNADGIYEAIDPSWWKYDNGDGTMQELSNLSLDHFTFESPNGEENKTTGYSTPYYIDNSGTDTSSCKVVDGNCYKKYNNYESVVLQIPLSAISKNGKEGLEDFEYYNPEFDDLFDNEDVSFDGDYVNIHPYDWNYSSYAHSNILDLGQYISAHGRQPWVWIDAAQSISKNYKTFLSTQVVQQPITYTIKDKIDVYDKNILYIKQEYVNNFLGVTSADSNGWFNAKISNDVNYADVFFRIGVQIPNGDMSQTGIANVKSISASSDFLGRKIETIDSLYLLVLKIVLLFLLLIILISIVSISIASNIFIEQFFQTIMLFKVMGYRNSEIQKMILGIFLPLNIFTIILGSIIPSIVILGVVYALANSGILFPLGFVWTVPLGVSFVMIALFMLIYFISYNKYIKLNIQEQITRD